MEFITELKNMNCAMQKVISSQLQSLEQKLKLHKEGDDYDDFEAFCNEEIGKCKAAMNRMIDEATSPILDSYALPNISKIYVLSKEYKNILEGYKNRALNETSVINNNEENFPSVLNTDKAKAILQKVIAAELCDSNYEWKDTIQLLAYFAYKMSAYLKLKVQTYSKNKRSIPATSWKPFQTLFKYNGKKLDKDQLKSARQNWLKYNAEFMPTGYEKIDALFK